MVFMQILCSLLIILTLTCLVENRSYNNGLIFYNMANQQIYLPPTISVSRGRGLAKFKYSPRGSIWSTFGKPCDCAGPLCGCCVGMKVKQYNFDQKICANVSYAPVKDEIRLEVILNDTSTAKYGIAARDPSPLCIPIMMSVPMSMCVQMSNVGLQGDNLNMCMDFMVRLGSSDLFEMHFQCMQVGLQGASWVGPNGQPVIPPSGGKLKDTSRDESEEYYDESVAGESIENEILSKEKEMQMNSEVLESTEHMEDEGDLNKAEEELDYNDITENIVETVNEHQQKESELMLEMTGNDAINKESTEEVPKISENVIVEDNRVFEQMEVTKEKPVSQAVQESEMLQMMENNVTPLNTNSMEAIRTELVETSTTDNDESNETKESVVDHMEIQQNDNINATKDELNFEKIVDQMNLNSGEENIYEKGIQTDSNSIEPESDKDAIKESITPMDIEMLPFTTGPNDDEEEETQTVEKFEMLVNLNEVETTAMSKTDHDSNNSLDVLQQAMDTSTPNTVAENFKPTLMPAATTSEISNDSIDNALTTASIMTSTTTKTTTTTSTMKMPFLSAAENANVPATFNENNQNDNDAHRNDEDDEDDNDDRIDNHGDDNSHENNSDYDDDEEESEEYEDETTEKLIETNDAATTTKTSMSIATNVLNNNNKIIESSNNATQATITANTANSNESISNKENENENEVEEEEVEEEENDSKEVQTESDEYEDEEYEDYDTTTVAASDTITHSLLNDTHAMQVDKSNSTNKAQMSHTDTMTISKDSNTLDVTTTSNQMPQFYAIPSSTAKTNTITSMTKAMPLPLARKIFALHQHKQRQFQQQQQQQQQQHQRHTHSHRYDV